MGLWRAFSAGRAGRIDMAGSPVGGATVRYWKVSVTYTACDTSTCLRLAAIYTRRCFVGCAILVAAEVAAAAAAGAGLRLAPGRSLP